jgi:hypothetical protein
MENTSHIIDAAGGRQAVIDALGIKLRVLQHHIQHGQLPAVWFWVLEDMANQPLPRNLFSFKQPRRGG